MSIRNGALRTSTGTRGEPSSAVIESTRAQANTPLTEIASQRKALDELTAQDQTATQHRDTVVTAAFFSALSKCPRFQARKESRQSKLSLKCLESHSCGPHLWKGVVYCLPPVVLGIGGLSCRRTRASGRFLCFFVHASLVVLVFVTRTKF